MKNMCRWGPPIVG